MLMKTDDSTLLIIDIQSRLLPALQEPERLVESAVWLLQVARYLQVPVICTEQYPRGLGHTVDELRSDLAADEILEKLHFSSAADGNLFQARGGNRRQFIVCGAETHVCVLQTVLQLLDAGREVYVVDEGVSSRHERDRQLALARMSAQGARIVSREMVAFEWMEKAGTESFKHISRNFIR